jgi:membrane protease YdiL (CAAX protease family)
MAIWSSTLNIRERILLTLKRVNIGYYLLYFLVCNFVLVQLFAFFRGEYAYMINGNLLSFDSQNEELIMVVILAPFLETIGYQHFLIFIVLFVSEKLTKKRSIILAIIIPAIYFASSHLPDYTYVVYAFLGALSFNIFYLIMKYRMRNAIFYTLLVHLLCNLLVFGLKHM